MTTIYIANLCGNNWTNTADGYTVILPPGETCLHLTNNIAGIPCPGIMQAYTVTTNGIQLTGQVTLVPFWHGVGDGGALAILVILMRVFGYWGKRGATGDMS